MYVLCSCMGSIGVRFRAQLLLSEFGIWVFWCIPEWAARVSAFRVERLGAKRDEVSGFWLAVSARTGYPALKSPQ